MKITVIYGVMHQGSTYNITQLFLEKLLKETDEVNEFFLPKDMPEFCTGCNCCFLKGEDKCPHFEKVKPIYKALEEADLIILASPSYVCSVTGAFKSFLDHLAFIWMPHRPNKEMFKKVGLVISTAAGAGTWKSIRVMRDSLFYWGVPKIFTLGINVAAIGWDEVELEKKAAIGRKVNKISKKIERAVGKVKPGYKTKILFYIMRLSQKNNNWNKTDKQHWQEHGWLDKKRPWK